MKNITNTLVEKIYSKIELVKPRITSSMPGLPRVKEFLSSSIKELNERRASLPTFSGPTFTKILISLLLIRSIRLLALGLCTYNVIFYPALIGTLYYYRKEILNDLLS